MPFQSKNLGPILILLIVVLVSGGAYITREGKWGEVLSIFGWEMKAETFILTSTASPGRVEAGFPQNLLNIVRDIRVEESASYEGVGEDAGKEKMTVRYTTPASPSDMFAAYSAFFSEEGYVLESTSNRWGTSSLDVRQGQTSVSLKIGSKTPGESVVDISVVRAVIE